MRVLSVNLFMNVSVVVVLFCVLQQIRMEQIDSASAQCKFIYERVCSSSSSTVLCSVVDKNGAD